MRRYAPLLALVVVASGAAPACAHGFDPDAGAAALFVAGARLPLLEPLALLVLLATGLMIGIRGGGLVAVASAVAAGVPAGLALAPFFEVRDLSRFVIAVALVNGLAGVAAWRYPVALVAGLAFAASFLVAFAIMLGHSFRDVPVAAYAGFFLSMSVLPWVVAGIVLGIRRLVGAGWVLIGFRVLASWTVAVSLMLLALGAR